jgi:hypothetical protein
VRPKAHRALLQRGEDEVNWGLDIDRWSFTQAVLITKVYAGGAVAEYNAALPRGSEKRIEAGDRLIQVNGSLGTSAMARVLKDRSLRQLRVFVTKASEASAQEDLREDLSKTLPEYNVTWNDDRHADLTRIRRTLFCQCSPRSSPPEFRLELLQDGTFVLQDCQKVVASKRSAQSATPEFVRLAGLVSQVSAREGERRRLNDALTACQESELPLSARTHQTTSSVTSGSVALLEPPRAADREDQPVVHTSRHRYSGKESSRSGHASSVSTITRQIRELVVAQAQGKLSDTEFQREAAGAIGWQLVMI